MSDPETYRRYAKDCLRIAEKMSASDKQTLLKISEAWEARAREAEQKQNRGTSGIDDVNGAAAL
jgi:hypothetical protein